MIRLAALLLALFYSPALADDVPIGAGGSPAPTVTQSTETSVAASTEAAVVSSTEPVVVYTAPKPRPERTILVHIHREAEDWEPVSVAAGGSPAGNSITRHVSKMKVNGKWRWTGRRSLATSSAHIYPVKDDQMLVVSLFPKTSGPLLPHHYEARFLITEGYLEGVKVAAVFVKNPEGRGLDSFELKRRGIDFREDFPGSGELNLSALNPRLGKKTLNAGHLSRAAFADPELGTVSLDFAARGLSQ